MSWLSYLCSFAEVTDVGLHGWLSVTIIRMNVLRANVWQPAGSFLFLQKEDEVIMKELRMAYLESFSLQGLWGDKEVEWKAIHSDVNVLVGINGSGKTTLLNLMYAYYAGDARELKKYPCRSIQGIPGVEEVYPIIYLRTLDKPVADKRKSESPLMQELNNVVFQNKEGISFFNYRMKMLDYREQADQIQRNIDELFGIVNEMFEDTGKVIDISKGNNSTLVFHQNGRTLSLEQLSSGEKQLLLILLKVFLLEKQPAIVFMDEPELSLHIRWQREIIDRIRQLNPLCQLVIATHSPSIFGTGWGDKVVYMEDIMR